MKGMVIKLKKMIALVGIIAALLCLSANVYADDTMKISMNGEVKSAKAVGNGSGITFTLPDVANNFLIDTIELCIFEKQENETTYKMFGESKMLENPTSLNINFDFGDVSKYQERAKYKIAYRYYVKPLDDLSKVIIAGAESKEGWRLVGEANPNISTEQGFVFYKNTSPALSIVGISYQAETISGLSTFTYDLNQLENVYLQADALQNGIIINYSATDYDSEDTPTVRYQLFDGISNVLLYTGIFDGSKTIYSNTNAEYVKVILSASDDWGGESEESTLPLKIDKEVPTVINQFADMGKALRDKNLYSKFTIMDDQNDALSSGNVYYSIKRDGNIVYENVRMSNDSGGFYTVDLSNQQDGEYEIILAIFDKAYNKTIHTLRQTLDNTAPSARFLTSAENISATEYSTWTNKSKKILITATDGIAGIKKCYGYRNYSSFASTSIGAPTQQYTFSYDVTSTMTGKIFHYFYVYDAACSIDKTNNMANINSSGNSCFLSCYVWLDKTPPDVIINADSNTWYPVPAAIYADAYDYPSVSNAYDNSGVKSKQYCITDDEISDNNWLNYNSGVTFNQGGVYYLHIKAADFAGNETIETKRIMLNTIAQITSAITPTDDGVHTVYNELTDMYIIKNTAFSTKYHFALKDDDVSDTIKTEIQLVSQDNAAYVSQTEVETNPNGSSVRDIAFNVAYTKADGNALPDGVYTVYLSISEVKNDESVIKTSENVKGCEVVIKRNAPPTPVISVLNGYVTIDYPNETLANSLNRADMKALYKREYKAVIDKQPDSNTYKSYVAPITIDDMVATALYTDMAGNISTASKRIYKESADDANSIVTEGNTVTIEEGRPANTYYIGTRRDKQAGINNSILNFLN